MNMNITTTGCSVHPWWESNILREQAHDLWGSAAIPIHCSEVLMSTWQGSICLSELGRQNQVSICYTFTGLNDSYQFLGFKFSGYILFCRYSYKQLVKPCCSNRVYLQGGRVRWTSVYVHIRVPVPTTPSLLGISPCCFWPPVKFLFMFSS